MRDTYGIILIDTTEIIIRIYAADQKEWKLLHYENHAIPKSENKNGRGIVITELLANYLTSEEAQSVSQWKSCARGIPDKTINYISSSIALEIGNLTYLREQELLCKGMFTELW